MTLAQLQALVTVIEQGSFTSASEVLGITQSAVSHAVASLESELGVTLVQRDRTGLALTDVGQRIVLQAREMLARAEIIRQDAAAASGLKAGKLRLGSFPSISARFLPGVLRLFRQRYPEIEIVLLEGANEEVRAWIEARVVDIGVVTLPAEGVVAVTPIVHDEWFAIVPTTHPLAQRTSVQIQRLAQEALILGSGGPVPLVQALFDEVQATMKLHLEVREIAAVLAMVQESMGVTIIPELALPFQLPSGLKALHLRPPAWRQLALAVPSRDTLSPAANMFLQQAEQWALAQGFLRRDDKPSN
jgi:DNA-binding transcriptional LysR family regulator